MIRNDLDHGQSDFQLGLEFDKLFLGLLFRLAVEKNELEIQLNVKYN